MVIAIESLLFLLVGIALALILTRIFGSAPARPAPPAGAPVVKLLRSPRSVDGREETRLLLNDQVVLTAANDGVRLAEYADEVEQLEAIAERLANALGVGVEFERVAARPAAPDQGVAIRDLPRISPDEIESGERRRRLDARQDGG